MTKNTLLLSAITIVALTLGWATATAVGQSHPLRSRHGEGATSPPTGMVAVTPEGKLYHRPDCGYIANVRTGSRCSPLARFYNSALYD